MTMRPERSSEDTQTERVSGQPVDSKAALWKPEETDPTAEREREQRRDDAVEPDATTEPVQRGE